MRKNLSGTEPYGRLSTHPALDLFLGRQIESLQTQVLTDPALMLVLSPLAAGGFHSQNGRQIELAAGKVQDGSGHAGIFIENSPGAPHHTELDSEPQPAGLAPSTPR